MKKYTYRSILIIIIIIILPTKLLAESELEIYINDFLSKSNEAGLILKEIETNLKEGSRKKVCSRQRKAAQLGLLANESLIKAFEIEGRTPPMEEIRASQRRWEAIFNEC